MKIRVYVLRMPTFFGIGLTPDAAVLAAVEAGAKKSEALKSGTMFQLPEGVKEVDVDGMGSINWIGGTPGERATKMVWNPLNKIWEIKLTQ